MSDNPNEHLVYQEVCKGLHQIDDFRAKLLALLPISSGAGIFLLLETNDGGGSHLWPIGLLGAVISFGLFVYEGRQTVVCGHLVRVGAELERSMGFDKGQFRGRPKPSGLDIEKPSDYLRREYLLRPSMPLASVIVYLAVIAGWILLPVAG